MTAQPPERSARLRDELEPDILPRQLRALERIAGRLNSDRPVPDPDFRARLDARVRDVAPAIAPAVDRGNLWRLAAAACIALGAGLLALAAIFAGHLGTAGG